MITALVIGDSSGIGLATAARLHAAGDTVHIAGRDAARLQAAVDEQPGLVPHRLDAADAPALVSLLNELETVDRLVVTLSGNAGAGTFVDLDIDVLRTAFEEKFWPTVTAVKSAVKHLSGHGSITLVGAVTARTGMPGTAGIGSLNAAVEGLVAPLAAELALIRVNAVSPGYVDTPWWNMLPDADRRALFDSVAAGLPTRRIATADDVAQAIVLLATNPSMTGTIVEVDGGAHLTA